MKGFIYKVTNIQNGKVYIGQTTRSIEERWKEHTRNAFHDDNYEYSNKFHRAIRKYGSGGFIVTQQEVFDATDMDQLKTSLNEAETKWILYFDCKDNGYNSSFGGDFNPMFGVKGKDNPCSVKINQYDLNGHYIKTWDSLADIKRFYGNTGNILKVCNKNRIINRKVTAFKSVWRYFNDEPNCTDIIIPEEEIEIRKAKYIKSSVIPKVKVYKLSLSGDKLQMFDSVADAAKSVNGCAAGICKVAKGKGHTYKGFKWAYV